MAEPGRVRRVGYPAWMGRSGPLPAAPRVRGLAPLARLAGTPFVTEAARPRRTNVGVYDRFAISDALLESLLAREEFTASGDASQRALEQAKGQEAIDAAIAAYDIDVAHVLGGRVVYDPNLPIDKEGETDGKDGSVRIGPRAFQGGGPGLVAALLHEITHANQARRHGDADPPSQIVLAYELMAYETAKTHAQELGLTPQYLAANQAVQERLLKALHPTNRAKLLADGKYWEIDPDLPTSDPDIFKDVGSRPS